MYLSTVRTARSSGRPVGAWKSLGANVFVLGAVSMVTDVSAEMITAVLPAYLVLGLGLSVAQYGVFDGLYTGVTAVTRLVGGYTADRLGAHKVVAAIGYGLSATAKLGLLAVGNATAAIGAVLAVDRLGKGVRTAPRDALITLSAPPSALGRAFGVHRSMDSVGAFLGPLVALAVLAASGQAFDAIFVVSFCVALFGVLLLVLFVNDRRERAPVTARGSLPAAFGLLRAAGFRRVQCAAVLLGLATVGDGFVYLLIQHQQNLPVLWFPLLAVGTNLAYLLLAIPLGRLADRLGRWRVVIGGHVALVLVYLLLATQGGGWPLLVITLVLYGGFYAATDGVLMAAAGPLLPERLRTTGLALLQTGQALAYLVSSVLFGAIWQLWGPATAGWLAALGVIVAVPMAAWWLRGAQREAQ